MKKITFCLILSTAINHIAFTQDCQLVPLVGEYMPINKSLDSIHEIIKTDSSNSYHLIFFRAFGQVNQIEIYYITVDSSGVVNASFIKNGIKNPLNDKKSFFFEDFKKIMINGWFQGICRSAVSFHESSRLFIANKKKILLSIFAIDGKIQALLKSDPRMSVVDTIFGKLNSFFLGNDVSN